MQALFITPILYLLIERFNCRFEISQPWIDIINPNEGMCPKTA